MAANTCTSTNGTVSGTDPDFILTKKINNPMGAILYIKYTMGTTTYLTVTFDLINPSLSTTDKYRIISKSGTTLQSYTFTIGAAGNYRIPIPVFPSEKTVAVNITPDAAAADAVIVANIMEY